MNRSTVTSPAITLLLLATLLLVISPTLAVPAAFDFNVRNPAVVNVLLFPVKESFPYRFTAPASVTPGAADVLLMTRFLISLFWKALAGMVCAVVPSISIAPSTTLNIPALLIVPYIPSLPIPVTVIVPPAAMFTFFAMGVVVVITG